MLRTYDDFATRDGWPGTRWVKYAPGPFDLWDRNTIAECPGGPAGALTLRIPEYSLVRPPHHVKALTLCSGALAPPDDGPLIVAVDMAARMLGTERNPFGVDPGDPRLSAAALVVLDPDSGVVMDFFVSNDRLYALYERLPFAQGRLGPYPAFTTLFRTPVATAPGQWHRYEIRYFPADDATEWWVDGSRVHRQARIGAPPGEEGPIVKIKSVRFGGGLFTLLDDLRDDRRRAGDRPPVPGLISPERGELFGQGGEIALRAIAVAGRDLAAPAAGA